MPEDPENLLLVYLRRIDTKLDKLAEDVADMKRRFTALEIQVGQIAATEANHHANLSLRLDRLETRLDRIERRLDLAEAPAA